MENQFSIPDLIKPNADPVISNQSKINRRKNKPVLKYKPPDFDQQWKDKSFKDRLKLIVAQHYGYTAILLVFQIYLALAEIYGFKVYHSPEDLDQIIPNVPRGHLKRYETMVITLHNDEIFDERIRNERIYNMIKNWWLS